MKPFHLALVLLCVICSQADTFAGAQNAVDATPPALPVLRDALPVPVESEPKLEQLDKSKGQIWRRATMQLTGSMCISCLMELQKKLREIPDVTYAKVKLASDQAPARVNGPSNDAVVTPGEVHKYADTVIIFNSQTVDFDKLLNFIKNEKYKASAIQNTMLSSN